MAFNIQELKLKDSHLDTFLSTPASAEDFSWGVSIGGAFSFAPSVKEGHQKEFMNSTLHAQLSASEKFDRFTQPVEWYAEYCFFLQNAGYTITEPQFSDQALGDNAVPVDSIILEFLKNKLDVTEFTLIKRIINLLETPDEGGGRVFALGSAQPMGTLANFQLGIGSELHNKNVAVSFGAFYYNTDKPINGHTLKAELKRGSGSFKASFQKFILDEAAFAKIRDAIKDKVGNNAKEQISELFLASLRK